ncbi:sensor histidine kinase [Alicyclobacillus acidiphilus]|uniref:sensor histidine kinase n=1 Tax=Alicyclobacillus acidiphilus TaxID=182455 RepID=UPI00082DB118|nr:HAMP domain-containing sensor histidine kinase [Alicyclobacillus acidiphilus]
MPTLRLYLRDIWIPYSLTVIGALFGIGVVWLAAIGASGRAHPIDLWDILYGLFLSILASSFGFTMHYVRRRRFLCAVLTQLESLQAIDEVERLKRVAISPEHSRMIELLDLYTVKFREDLQRIEAKRLFYEHFTTRFAHQMKTPLTVLRLLEQELAAEMERVESTDLRQMVDPVFTGMNTELAKIETTLDTMLYTARLQSFSFDAHMSRFPLEPFLRKLVNEHKTSWIARKIYPRIEMAGNSDIHVTSDPKWLHFVCDQIVRNALQYGYRVDEAGRATGESAAFVISVRHVNEATHIEFQDEGIGMSRRDLLRMFEPFYTGENGRSHSRSTGMGLYLVSEVAQRLGLKVSAKSELHKGTTVTVTIPSASFLEPYRRSSNVTKM